jgi:hypothetical protein
LFQNPVGTATKLPMDKFLEKPIICPVFPLKSRKPDKPNLSLQKTEVLEQPHLAAFSGAGSKLTGF